MTVFNKIFCTLFFVFFSSAAFAGGSVMPAPSATTFSSAEETSASIGLRLEFGDVIKPSIVGTVRHTRTDTSNDVSGALADIAIPLIPEGFDKSVFRVMGIYGDTDVQGLAGLGYDFGKEQGLVGVGVQGEYIDGGINFGLDGSIAPYIGASTYDGAPSREVNSTSGMPIGLTPYLPMMDLTGLAGQ